MSNITDCTIQQEDINKLFARQMKINSKKCHILSITQQTLKPTTTYLFGAETYHVSTLNHTLV